MFLIPYTCLSWAYQLHYYLCFRTHRRKVLFSSRADELTEVVNKICSWHEYHLLGCRPGADELRCLLSLQPGHSVARVMQTLKSNSSGECVQRFGLSVPVWARGYLAQSVGRMRIAAVQTYLEQQPSHHGYDVRRLPPVYRYRAMTPVELKASHASFDLAHHVVLATNRRKGVFSSTIGQELSDYWLKVATARDFAIDQISIVPDHVHLIVRIVPKMSIEECVLLLMNNGQFFIGKNYPTVIDRA